MKKFWKKIEIQKKHLNSYYILLDSKILKTPLKKKLIVPNKKLANEILNEWSQVKDIRHIEKMIFYAILSTSIDKTLFNPTSPVVADSELVGLKLLKMPDGDATFTILP